MCEKAEGKSEKERTRNPVAHARTPSSLGPGPLLHVSYNLDLSSALCILPPHILMALMEEVLDIYAMNTLNTSLTLARQTRRRKLLPTPAQLPLSPHNS